MSVRRCVLVLVAAAALAGCGTAIRVAYNNGDIALRFVAHDYLDLHGEQQEVLQGQLARFHAWHRREELPLYAGLLDGAADRVGRGLAREDVTWALAGLRQRYRALVEQAVDEAAPLAATLRADNFRALERKFEKSNEQFAKDFVSGDAAKQARARAKRMSERLADWIGELTPEQEALILQFTRAQPGITAAALDNRKRRQAEFVALLREHQSAPDLGARLRTFLLDWERDRTPEHARALREWEDRLATLFVDLDRTLAPRQRERAVRRLQSYAEDFAVLARQGRPRGTTAALALEPAPVAR